MVPRASTLLADAKLNLTRADLAFVLCARQSAAAVHAVEDCRDICKFIVYGNRRLILIKKLIKSLNNNHFLEYDWNGPVLARKVAERKMRDRLARMRMEVPLAG